MTLERLLGGCVLILVAATWPLWLPHPQFPRVPLFAWSFPTAVDWLGLALLEIASGVLIAKPRWRRLGGGLVALGFGLEFLGDQLRLQPWAWQFFLLALVLSLGTRSTFVRCWRILVISIYLYSALSKLDAAFLTGSGWKLLLPFGDFGIPANSPSLPWPLVLPLGELLVALLLAVHRTRDWGRRASYVLHLGLLLVLGPWGLNHSWGVLLWNVFFLCQNWLLFRTDDVADAADGPSMVKAGVWSDRLAWGVLGTACLWPALYPWGLCDAWIGWAVYAPPFERVTVTVRNPAAAGVPPEWPAEIFQPEADDDFLAESVGRVVDFNRWTLTTLGVPSYPSSRHRIAVALAISEKLGADGVTVRIDRRWSRLQATFPATPALVLRTRAELEEYAHRYRFNAQPSD